MPLTATTWATTAENVARQWQITRQQQDEFAVGSQNKAEAAMKAGKFNDEIVPVTVKSRKGDIVVDTDEYPKAGVTMDGIGKLRPAFAKDGSVTAANASGINDGAAAVVLMKASDAAKEGRKVLARIVSWAHAGVDPAIMGTGPIPASRAALKKAGWNIGDLDLIEANEAFAAQACAVNKDLGWDAGGNGRAAGGGGPAPHPARSRAEICGGCSIRRTGQASSASTSCTGGSHTPVPHACPPGGLEMA